eukprot:TRINITY_DN34551_c0_g1_i1.p1 TRINITY_DN34551_c0_g1~~TRINITY_DN34551_c0_g1_i1.p1  ORF type:complete len:423 (+),score=76.39 TRINITY_DN34551_c0_g1_i1:107-1375(+)
MAADPFGLVNRALARGRGRGGGYGAAAGRGYRRKVRDPSNPADAAILRSLYPDFDELMVESSVDYRTMCKTDAEFARKFGLPPLLDATRTFREHSDSVDAVAWAPEPGTFVSASHDKTLKVWDTGGRCLNTLTGHTAGVYHCAMAPSGSILLSCGAGEDKNVLMWQWPQKKVARPLAGHTCAVHHVAISGDSTCASTADKEGNVIVHDLAKGAKVLERSMHSNVAHGSVFCRENPKLLITYGRDGNIQLLDVREHATSSAKQAFMMPSATANSVFIRSSLGIDAAHDGVDVYAAEYVNEHTLFSGGADNKAKRWDLRKATEGFSTRGKPPASSCVEEFLGHSGAIRSIAVTNDLRFLASGCEDGSCRLWTANSSKPAAGHHLALRALVGHVSMVSGCAFRDNSLLSCSWDQTVRMFDIPKNL